ncbi:MAG: PAS domain S-box protein [Deltaproteobacteria bacterium]|nr:PAS domain S-box protein [Deltaproteobacteria bacterium]
MSAPDDPRLAPLEVPEAPALLAAVLELGRELHLEKGERELVDTFLEALVQLFPRRALAIRVVDARSVDAARCYAFFGVLRDGVEHDRVVVKESSVIKTRLKSAVAASARLKIDPRWDSPFRNIASGFAVPLVASGELYGVLDVGYPLGLDATATDEPLVLPIANQLAVALRNLRLHGDTMALRDYQARLIDHANALIVGIDRGWRITVCNKALLELTGYQRDEVMGSDLRDILPADQRARLTRVFAAALRGAHHDAVEVMLHSRRLGRVRTVWSIAAIGSGGRQVEAVVAIGQDQSRLHELERQIIQAERLATLGQLAAGVVHELNNPLTSITVYAEYLLRKLERALADNTGAVPEAADIEKLRRIAAGAQRIHRFARELVQYAKPVGTEVEVVDVNAVVRQALSFCEHLFERARIELVVELDEHVPALHAVPGQLEQVVINLVTNAAHAVEDGGRIRVRTRREGPDQVAIEIDDSGPGIPVDDRRRVFEPFFTTKTDGKGTGLGLSIVKNIIEQHRGTIEIETSDQLGGARMLVRLPPAQ